MGGARGQLDTLDQNRGVATIVRKIFTKFPLLARRDADVPVVLPIAPTLAKPLPSPSAPFVLSPPPVPGFLKAKLPELSLYLVHPWRGCRIRESTLARLLSSLRSVFIVIILSFSSSVKNFAWTPRI